jgi:hypothetical protein
MFPAFKPLPKVFAKPVGYLSFSSAVDLNHDVPGILQELHYFLRPWIVLRRVFGMLVPLWPLGREAPLLREAEG